MELWHSRWRRVTLALYWGFGFTVETGGERRELIVYSNLLGLALWLHLPFPWRNLRKQERRWGFTIHDGSFYWSWAEPTMEWRSKDPRWMRFSLNAMDLIFGRQKHAMEEGEDVPVVVPMPEGSYPATVKKVERVWIRSRLPFWRRRRTDFKIDIPGGIPFMGKGENSWDCGDDGLWGTGGDSLEGAIANAVKSVLENRKRHGECASTRGRVVWARPQQAVPS